LGKSFIFYTEVHVEGKLMDCIYLNGDQCRAQPYIQEVIGRVGDTMRFYKPTEEDKNTFCKQPDFEGCPRFKAYQDDLKARGLKAE